MRVAVAAEVNHTHEELIERILQAGLAYAESVDAHTSLVVCDAAAPEQGKGFQAGELGVPLIGGTDFLRLLGVVVGGTAVEEFTDPTTRRSAGAVLNQSQIRPG